MRNVTDYIVQMVIVVDFIRDTLYRIVSCPVNNHKHAQSTHIWAAYDIPFDVMMHLTTRLCVLITWHSTTHVRCFKYLKSNFFLAFPFFDTFCIFLFTFDHLSVVFSALQSCFGVFLVLKHWIELNWNLRGHQWAAHEVFKTQLKSTRMRIKILPKLISSKIPHLTNSKLKIPYRKYWFSSVAVNNSIGCSSVFIICHSAFSMMKSSMRLFMNCFIFKLGQIDARIECYGGR